MTNCSKRILSVFPVVFFALGLMLSGSFPSASTNIKMEDEINTEETVLEETDTEMDNRETVLEDIGWSMAFCEKKIWLVTEHEVKNVRAALERVAEEEIESGEPSIAAYYKFLKDKWNSNPSYVHEIRFRLVYIDGDDIPELLFMEPFCHADGVEVYAYCDNKVIEVGEFGSSGRMQYVEKEGMIHSGFFNMGEGDDGFYKLEKGALEKICDMHDYDAEKVYEIDGVSVSKETYHEKWDELWSDDFITIGYDDGIMVKDILDLKGLLTQEAENLKSGLDVE